MKPGLTLIELLVVLIFVGAAASVVTPALVRRPGPALDTAGAVAELIRWAQRQAATRGHEARFVLEPASGRYWVGSDRNWPLDMWRSGELDRHAATAILYGEDLLTLRIAVGGATTHARLFFAHGGDTVAVMVRTSAPWPEPVPRGAGAH